MPGGSRSLPGRPNLRYLKLEAKRRVAVGEFPALHEAQAAIAREHGLPSWAVVKRHISENQDARALDQLRWVIARAPVRTRGEVPAPVAEIAEQAFAELGPTALVLAGGDREAAVTTRLRDQRTHVVLTSRLIPVNSIETRLLRAWTDPA